EGDWFSKIAFLLATINKFLDTAVPSVIVISIFVLNSYVLFTWFQNENKRQKNPTLPGLVSSLSRSFYLFGIFIAIQLVIAILFFYIPRLVPQKFIELIQWFEIYITVYLFVYFSTKKYSGYRGGRTAIYHITALLIGWIYGEWL